MARQKIDLTPQVLDLVLYAGDGAQIRITVRTSTNTPVDLSGTMKAQIRAEREDPDPPLADFSVDMTDAVDGVVIIGLTGDDTHALITGDEKFSGAWDLQWTPTGSEPQTIVQGKAECNPDVTH